MHIWSEREQRLQPSLPPTFVRVIQLEDIWVLGIIRQLHHPACDGDLLARCRFILKKSNSQLGGLGHTLPSARETSMDQTNVLPTLALAATAVTPTRGIPARAVFRGLTCFLSVPRKDLAP